LRGDGIEIGALNSPLKLPDSARVRYVDRFDLSGVRFQYPELNRQQLAPIDVVDDGETLIQFADSSLDFIIANHFLEHTQDPIGTLRRFFTVLKPKGIAYLAVPDKRFTFDCDRPLTTLEHFYADHEQGPANSYMDHLVEYTRLVQKLEGEEAEAHIRWMIERNYSLHFHVWTNDSLLAFLLDIRRRYSIPFAIQALVFNEPLGETITIMQKT
jgi:SAM-dependent methyltransferase